MSFGPADFKSYRQIIGFTNQTVAKSFFGAKDVVAPIDESYLSELNDRLVQIVERVNRALPEAGKIGDLDRFNQNYVRDAYEIIRESQIIGRLNNRGRRPEEVYFSWMRGFLMAQLFRPSMLEMFEVGDLRFNSLGADDLRNPETFAKNPTADAMVRVGGENVRVEIQAGFQGVNDVKRHKIEEARRMFESNGEKSLAVHLDAYNGQGAVLRLDTVSDEDEHWITREQMEGQRVYNIDQNHFVWLFVDRVPKIGELGILA